MSPDLWHNLLYFAQHNWLLLAAFIVIVILIFAEEGKSRGTGGGQVNPKQAVALMNDHTAIVVDLRPKDAYKSGHIIGAISMPKEQFDVNSQKLKNHQHKSIIVVCTRGNDSNRIALKLRKAGYDSKVLAGGIDAWKAADLPLKTKK